MMVELNNAGTEDTHSSTRTALIVPSVFAHVQHTDHRDGTTVGECKQIAISQPNKHIAWLMNTRTSTAQPSGRNPVLILTLFGSANW